MRLEFLPVSPSNPTRLSALLISQLFLDCHVIFHAFYILTTKYLVLKMDWKKFIIYLQNHTGIFLYVD